MLLQMKAEHNFFFLEKKKKKQIGMCHLATSL